MRLRSRGRHFKPGQRTGVGLTGRIVPAHTRVITIILHTLPRTTIPSTITTLCRLSIITRIRPGPITGKYDFQRGLEERPRICYINRSSQQL